VFNIFVNLKKDELYYNFRIFSKNFRIFRIFDFFKIINNINEHLKLCTSRTESASRGNLFFWKNRNKFTQKEKIWYISQQFYERLGYFPDLVNPKTFNEKLNWMKLHYYNPLETRCIDKYEFKNYIKEKLGDGYTIPLLGVWDSVDEIDFDRLPEKFVIKTNHGGGGQEGIYVVNEKFKENINKIKYLFNDWLQPWNNVYYSSILPGYQNIKPKIIVENNNTISMECRVYCFHGEVKFVLLKEAYELYNRTRLVDKNFNDILFYIRHKPYKLINKKPYYFEEIVRLSEILSKEFPFVRVDFMISENKIYVGELTFTPAGGYNIIKPVDWDYKIGEWLDLTKLNRDYLTDNDPKTLKVVGG